MAVKTKRGLKESALKANSTSGTIPVGYIIENKKLVIDERNKYVPKLVFDLFVEGKSKTEICNALIYRKFKTTKGNNPKISTIDSILKNKKYVPKQKLEDYVIDITTNEVLTSEKIKNIAEKVVEIANEDYDEREVANLTKQIKKIDNEINKATEMLITTDVDSATMSKRHRKISAKIPY